MSRKRPLSLWGKGRFLFGGSMRGVNKIAGLRRAGVVLVALLLLLTMLLARIFSIQFFRFEHYQNNHWNSPYQIGIVIYF